MYTYIIYNYIYSGFRSASKSYQINLMSLTFNLNNTAKIYHLSFYNETFKKFLLVVLPIYATFYYFILNMSQNHWSDWIQQRHDVMLK